MQDSYYVLLSHTWYDYSNKIGWVITPQIYATRFRSQLSLSLFSSQGGMEKALGVSSQHLKNNNTISAKRPRGAPR